MTTPTWQQQNRRALKQAAVIVPAIVLTVGVCCAGASLLPDEPSPPVDSPPAATPGPDRTNEIFNPVDGAPSTGAPETVPALPEPPPPGPNPEPNPNPPPPPEPEPEPEPEEEDVYYANCAEARRAGAAPIYRGEPGYRRGLDRDNDGVACD